jgi:hypothetical protein
MIPALVTASIGHGAKQFEQITAGPAEREINTLPGRHRLGHQDGTLGHDEAPYEKGLCEKTPC